MHANSVRHAVELRKGHDAEEDSFPGTGASSLRPTPWS